MTTYQSGCDGITPNPSRALDARFHAAKPPALGRSMRTGMLCGLFGLASSVLVPSTQAWAAPGGVGTLVPGTIVVAQGGTIFGALGTGIGPTVEANGEVDFYSRNSNGDVAPEARFTNGMYGPVAMAFDRSGGLWVANINTGNLVELTRAQLTMPGPVPGVTITLPAGAAALPTGMAFDPPGDLWVVDSGASQVVEYTEAQLAMSGAPTPHSTISISQLPGAPLGDMFDRKGDLWVTINLSPSCPQGCVVEFSKTELAQTNPMPTVTISSIGGANMAFTESGDMWMVTGGGVSLARLTASALLVPINWWNSPRHSLRRRARLRRPLRSAQPTLTRLGLCSALMAWPSTHPVTCGSPTSTNQLPSSTASTSFPDRARPSPSGRSAVPTPK
jgi:hypothetical protein